MRLYAHGELRRVVVDDHIPVLQPGDRPLFARSRRDGEMWVAVFEKAFAKLHSSYQAIEAGSPGQALECLTGAPSERLQFRTSEASEDKVWQRLLKAEGAGHVMALELGDHPQDLQKMVGLVEQHAYSVLSVADADGRGRLVQIRNPWGRFEWRGDWGDESSKWTEKLKAKLGWTKEDDGIFWMDVASGAL